MTSHVHHFTNFYTIRVKDSPCVTLLVGKEQARFSCHKTLLSFYSAFFDKALYGAFKDAGSSEIVLPEENEQEMSKFVTWLYTGALKCEYEFPACALWVLGDKLGAPAFINEAMYSIGDHYAAENLFAATAQYVYSNTIPGSKLRSFLCDVIQFEGPFAAETTAGWEKDEVQIYHAEWISLLGQGGDIVTDNIKTGFRKHGVKRSTPWGNERISKYLVDEDTADPERAKVWHKEKMKVDAEWKKDRDQHGAMQGASLNKVSPDGIGFVDLTSTDDDGIAGRSRRSGSAPL